MDRTRDWLFGLAEPDRAQPVRLPEPEERAVYRILNFALRAGGLMLSSGAGTIEVESIILELTAACGLLHCEVDVTFTSMTASYIRGDDVEPVTTLQVVRHRRVDYSRLANVYALRADLVAGRITPDEALARLDAIVAGTKARRRTLVVLSWAGMAAAFTVLLGGGVLVAAVAFVSTSVVYMANLSLARRAIPDFFLSAFGAAVATMFATVLVAANAPATASLVVAGGIMVLVPGYALVASVQDALTGFPISGSARGLEVLLTAAGIITGVAGGLYLSITLGVRVHLQSVQLLPVVHVPVQVAAAGVAAALYAAATSVPRRSIPWAGIAGAIGWGTFLALRHGGGSLIFATAVAAVVVGALGNVFAGRRQTHPFLFVVPGIMPLVPGLTIYQGMFNLFTGENGGGPATLFRALGMGLAIAAGVTFGNMVIKPLRRPRRPL